MKFILIFSLLLLAGCDYNHQKESGSQKVKITSEKMSSPDFQTIETSVLGPKCYSCHTGMTGSKGGLDIQGYAKTRSQLSKIAYRVLEKQDMPPRGKLSGNEQQLLSNWIESGAPITSTTEEKTSDGLDDGPLGWDKIRDSVLKTKCLDCHSPPNAQANLDLTSLAEVRTKASVLFDRVIIKQDMPITPYPVLTPRERKALLKWFDSGMPE